jgi:hypothetical protein
MQRINIENYVVSLYTPLYKLQSRKCGDQAFHQTSGKQSGVHSEICHIRERQHENQGQLDKFHRGILLVGSADTSIPPFFSTLSMRYAFILKIIQTIMTLFVVLILSNAVWSFLNFYVRYTI